MNRTIKDRYTNEWDDNVDAKLILIWSHGIGLLTILLVFVDSP